MLLETYFKPNKSKNHKSKLEPITIFFVTSNILDLLTTLIGISLGYPETNPLVVNDPQFGWIYFFLLKTILVLAIVFYYEFTFETINKNYIRFSLFLIMNIFTIDMLKTVIENIMIILRVSFH